MDKELEELRRTLRSVVVSSPTPIDVQTLTRDYCALMGERLPLHKFGYRDCLTLLRERCSDCFLFQGSPSNPFLTLIVPDGLKHIEKLVRKNKNKKRGKRRRTPRTPSPTRANHQPPPDDYDFGCPKLPLYNGRHGSESRGSHSESKDTNRGRSEGGDRQAMLDMVTLQLIELLATHADGIWATELMTLYREKFGHELRVDRYGVSSMTAFVRLLEGTAFHVRRPEPLGNWRLYNIRDPPPPENAPPAPPAARAQNPSAASASSPPCAPVETAMGFLNSIQPAYTADIECGQLLDVIVGEVYSPSHFWLLRYDNDHIVPLYAIMDAMTHYYEGEGSALSLEAETKVRAGVHCAALYAGDWHRAIVARVLEDDTVVLRHLDYGTVSRAKVRDLKPLSLRWSKLPTQAIRARLVGLRPPARNRHWPISSSTEFLELVRERPLVADVVAVDHEEGILEVYLVDTSTDEDVCINERLLQQDFADGRRGSSFGDTACYLRPTFEALESGATPNYAEIVDLVNNDISLFCIEDYRRHVMDEPSLPPASAPSPVPHHASAPSPVPHHASAPSPVPHHASAPSPVPHHASAPSPVPHHASAPSPVPHHASASSLAPYYASASHHQSAPSPAPLDASAHPPAPLHEFAVPLPPAPLHTYAPPTAALLPHAPVHAPVALRTGPEMRISAPLSFVRHTWFVPKPPPSPVPSQFMPPSS